MLIKFLKIEKLKSLIKDRVLAAESDKFLLELAMNMFGLLFNNSIGTIRNLI